jgi:hypothetical protein
VGVHAERHPARSVVVGGDRPREARLDQARHRGEILPARRPHPDPRAPAQEGTPSTIAMSTMPLPSRRKAAAAR